jgi:hypothetical protein
MRGAAFSDGMRRIVLVDEICVKALTLSDKVQVEAFLFPVPATAPSGRQPLAPLMITLKPCRRPGSRAARSNSPHCCASE